MIVAFSGPAQSGKTSAAQYLANTRGYVVASFADPIRDAAFRLDPIVSGGVTLREAVGDLGWQRAKLAYPEVRRTLQKLGTEVGREMFGLDCWVDRALAMIADDEPVAFDDTRFDNEARAVRATGGIIVEIRRPDYEYSGAHASETGLSGAADASILAVDLKDLHVRLDRFLASDIYISAQLKMETT